MTFYFYYDMISMFPFVFRFVFVSYFDVIIIIIKVICNRYMSMMGIYEI